MQMAQVGGAACELNLKYEIKKRRQRKVTESSLFFFNYRLVAATLIGRRLICIRRWHGASLEDHRMQMKPVIDTCSVTDLEVQGQKVGKKSLRIESIAKN